MLREGEVRYSWTAGQSTTPAYLLPSHTFTSQYSDSYINLLWYGSRHYDPEIGRFTQADSIVPGGSQGLDRYAYGLNNPSRYTDPSGHVAVEGCGDEGKNACHASDLEKAINAQKWAELQYDPSGQKQEQNAEIAETILYDGTELVASVLFEPADWAFTASHCFNGECSPWVLAGFLPFIPSIAGKHADNLTDMVKLGDDALVCRGGMCKAEQFSNGSGVTMNPDGTLSNVSVNSQPGATLDELTTTIPNGQVGVTTVGDIRATGGNVVPDPLPNNPYHANMSGITPQQAERLFTPTIPNPNRFRPR